MQDSQITDTVLMIRPARFMSNPQTAASNAFQRADATATGNAAQPAAAREFDALAATLEAAGVNVLVYNDTDAPEKPDAIFPNNWLSTHADGTAVLYPMHAQNRRPERRPDIVEDLAARSFGVERVLDLSGDEQREEFLEGTGSLVLDRVNRVAYACLSPRTHRDALNRWAAQLGYDVVAFDAADENGRAIYHTNVLMSIGRHIAVVCLAAITSVIEREQVQSKLAASGRQVVEISFAQMHAFAGNMLELATRDGGSVMVMSERARASLAPRQLEIISRDAKVISVPVATIEDHSGGSVRCMLAEMFLPRKAAGKAVNG